jgi:hypothetical protein
MQVEKRCGHHVAVKPSHVRDGPGGKPGGLLACQAETVRHPGEHPAAGNQGIGGGNLDNGATRAKRNSGRIQRDRRIKVSVCQQAG